MRRSALSDRGINDIDGREDDDDDNDDVLLPLTYRSDGLSALTDVLGVSGLFCEEERLNVLLVDELCCCEVSIGVLFFLEPPVSQESMITLPLF